jgi:hypothetical protein
MNEIHTLWISLQSTESLFSNFFLVFFYLLCFFIPFVLHFSIFLRPYPSKFFTSSLPVHNFPVWFFFVSFLVVLATLLVFLLEHFPSVFRNVKLLSRDSWFLYDRISHFYFTSSLFSCDRLCSIVVRVPGYWTEMYCASCEVRTEFICVM